MLPFLQQKVAARKLIIYSDPGKPNPLIAAELTNSTGQTLDGGPVTVSDAGAYAGEALVETIKSGDKRFLSYGVDLGTRIATNLDSHNDNVRELHVHNGMLITRSALIQKRTYSIHNVDARAKTLIVEYPVHSGFTLIDTAKPAETAREVYRFEVKVPASGSVDFPVTEENVYDQQTAVSSITPDTLLVYVRNKNLSDNARRQLQQVADLKTKIAGNDSEKRRIDTDIQNVTRDEERNRQNIQSLQSVSGQQQIVQDYARKLSAQETQIAVLRDRQAQLDTEKASLQTQLNAQIDQLSF
jgi:N-methylhydantoinase B/oxoprolinase/acetone carboxylase alpha subunit